MSVLSQLKLLCFLCSFCDGGLLECHLLYVILLCILSSEWHCWCFVACYNRVQIYCNSLSVNNELWKKLKDASFHLAT
jgi:hypothetical protein